MGDEGATISGEPSINKNQMKQLISTDVRANVKKSLGFWRLQRSM
jgi:hypothetical protein